MATPPLSSPRPCTPCRLDCRPTCRGACPGVPAPAPVAATPAARTIATIPARRASGRSGHRSTIRSRSCESVLACWLALFCGFEAFSVGARGLSTDSASPSRSAWNPRFSSEISVFSQETSPAVVTRLEGVGPPTAGSEVRCSIQLSYRRKVLSDNDFLPEPLNVSSPKSGRGVNLASVLRPNAR